ncbi:MAG: SO_0444 family Cu/Zn efflux transporter [Gammaproteobacteria bacterium]|nr:SO_0444 family Cu/Zn efflux transporter [Gammaproteobacteria bacterium]
MELLVRFLDFLWSSFLLLAPMLLLGLFLAGVIHVFISRQAILKWLRQDSLKSVSSSAAIGVPMPLCSCSVVPVVAEMRRKGASRSACMSFLITAPETGADSILVTHAFFGPVAAVVRPVISFITGVVAGIFCIGLIRDRDATDSGDAHEDRDHQAHHGHHHGHDHHDHDHDHSHEPLIPGSDDCYVSPRELRGFFFSWVRRLSEGVGRIRTTTWIKPDFYREFLPPRQDLPSPTSTAERDLSGLSFGTVCRHILRYGFVDVADDILFALLVGVALGGVLYLAIPSDLMAHEYARWISYPVMVLVGVPLYICASASTPIAAALVAKGFSPGAALIFLMTGPATNTGTIAIIVSQFGARFATVYVGSVIAVTVALGIVVDLLLIAFGLSLPVNLEASDSPVLMAVQWGGALGLIALIVWRFRAGAMKSGYQDLMSNLRPWSLPTREWWTRMTRSAPLTGVIHPRAPAGRTVWLALVAVFLLSGFTVVRPGEVGYGRLFGAVVWRDLPPGLHYLAPRPFALVDKWPVREVKSITSGDQSEYLTGDVNLMSMSMNLQYRVRDPYVYHYRAANPEQVIADNVRKELRKFASGRTLDGLLNVDREALQDHIANVFEKRVPGGDSELLDAIELVKVSLLSVSPVDAAMNAFREVSSSQDDRERIIVNAQRLVVSLIPRAHGNATYEIEQAKGEAVRRTMTSAAESGAIRVVAGAVREAPEVLHNMLWREKLETSLAGRNKIIVPSEETLSKVAVWKSSNSATPAASHH